jgi:hypothetical protein
VLVLASFLDPVPLELLMNFRGLIGAVLFIIGLVMGLAGVKAGTSPLVIAGLVLIVVGLAIPYSGGK